MRAHHSSEPGARTKHGGKIWRERRFALKVVGVRMLPVICVSVALAQAAHAEPRIVLVETQGAPELPALASQVEVHAMHRASVEVRKEADADPMTYAERASQLVASGEAAI